MKEKTTPSMELKPFDKDAEVIGSILYLYVDTMAEFVRKPLLEALEKAGIERTVEFSWVTVENLLSFYDHILHKFGQHTVFDIGKIGPEVLPFPLEATDLVEIIRNFDTLYQSNHRNGYVGFFHLVEHSEEDKKMIVRVYNPYPRMLNKGILTGFGRRFGTMTRVDDLQTHPLQTKSIHDQWFVVTYRD